MRALASSPLQPRPGLATASRTCTGQISPTSPAPDNLLLIGCGDQPTQPCHVCVRSTPRWRAAATYVRYVGTKHLRSTYVRASSVPDIARVPHQPCAAPPVRGSGPGCSMGISSAHPKRVSCTIRPLCFLQRRLLGLFDAQQPNRRWHALGPALPARPYPVESRGHYETWLQTPLSRLVDGLPH